MNIQKSIDIIHSIDKLYQTSPTVQSLTSNAPMFLSLFREMKHDLNRRRMEIEQICAQREYDLAKFREVAPILSREISLIGQHIRDLQKTVRETAATLGNNPNAQTVINYTNMQISESIQMFNTLSLNLLTS